MASYPGSIPNFAESSPANLGDADSTGRTHSQRHDAVEDELEAALTTLGVNPHTGAASVAARLAAIEADIAGIDAGAGTALGSRFVSVADHGAVGDGSTDDTAAINAAIAAAGIGGTVYFPAHAWGGGTSGASYRVSSTLKPYRAQRWIGGHTPAYDTDEYFLSSCVIRATSSFTGSALIACDTTMHSGQGNMDVEFHNLGFQGRGELHGTAMLGVDGGSTSSGNERNWSFWSCQFSAFSAAAIGGCWVVLNMYLCMFHRNMRAVAPTKMTDAKLIGCYGAFNVESGFDLNANLTSHSGQIELVSCRFERSGVTPGTNATENRRTNAPGIHLGGIVDSSLIGCSTDGNTGPGLWIEDKTSASRYNYSITVTGCRFIRDGVGDLTSTTLPGVMVKDTAKVYFGDCIIEYGYPTDGVPGWDAPQRGLHIEDVTYLTWNMGAIELLATWDTASSVYLTGGYASIIVNLPRLGFYGNVLKASNKTTDYTLVMGDVGRIIEHNSSTPHTFYVPPNSSVAFPLGAMVDVFNVGTGTLTIAGGSGVTMQPSSGLTLAQYKAATLIKRATNTWAVVGGLG